MEFLNKNVLIVGASSGIGAEIVRLLSLKGANIYAIGRREPEIACKYHFWDAENISSDFISILPETLNNIVYCPGTINLKPASRLNVADYQRDLQINFLGLTFIVNSCLDKLKKAENSSLITFSSVASKLGMPFHTSISASKGALEGYTKSLAAELANLNIRVNCIAPSLTDTPLAHQLLSTDEKRELNAKRHPINKIGKPMDIAEMAIFLLSEKASWITGQIISIDGGLSTLKV